MRTQLQYHPAIEKSLNNLKAMGLRVQILPETDNEVFIFIDLQSVLNLISRRIKYPFQKIHVESGQVIIHIRREP